MRRTLEILEARPDIEVIVVPVGGGSGASGACLAAKAVCPSIEVIGVAVRGGPGRLPLLAGLLVEDTTSTFAEALIASSCSRTGYLLRQPAWTDFVLVTEAALRDAYPADDRKDP